MTEGKFPDLMLFDRYLEEIRAIANANRRIASHAIMEDAFHAAFEARPELIVELGTGVKGLRTQAMCRAAALWDAWLVSLDIKDCSGCGNSWYPRWRFVQAEAIAFASQWPSWSKENLGGEMPVDVLFIDLDELYKTTVAAWRAWKGYLADATTVMFRCTNLKKELVYRDGTRTGLGWDNKRGVIRTIEDELGIRFNEAHPYFGRQQGWEITHIPWGAGLTILRREAQERGEREGNEA